MISVIIPIFNKEKSIQRCIDSILANDVAVELILVDDGSVDNSSEICEHYCKKYDHIQLVRQSNSGVSVARNAGIDLAKGEWIAFVDPDDYIHPKMFSILLSESKEYDIVASCCYAVDKAEVIENLFFNGDLIVENESAKDDLYCQLLNDRYKQPGPTYTAIGVPWGKLYKASFIHENRLRFNSKLRRQQDNIFNMHAFSLAHRIKYLNIPLYYYELDNIKNYYVSKYNPYATTNAIELQKERYSFFSSKFESKQIKKFYDDETISVIFSALNKDILNRDNKVSYKTKKKRYYELVKSESFYKSIMMIDIKNIHGVIHKIVYYLVKKNNFFILYNIWKTRGMYEILKFRG